MALSPEEWRPVVGQEGRYEVSDLGRVRSLRFRNRMADFARSEPLVLKEGVSPKGYRNVQISGRTRSIHSLVAEAFIGPRASDQQVCHRNGVRNDNRLSNLKYGNPTENQADKIEHGTKLFGEQTSSAKLKPEDVSAIRSAGRGRGKARELAAQYGVSENTIYNVMSGKHWGHLLATPGERENGDA